MIRRFTVLRVTRRFTAFVLFAALLLFVAAGMANASPVALTNPGFETGDFTGWTQGGNLSFTLVHLDAAHSGTYGAVFGPIGSDGYIEQTFASTPGNAYEVSFWLMNRGGLTPNDFSAMFDGVKAISIADANYFDWTRYSYTATASAAATTMRFSFRHDWVAWYFDDVSVNDLGGRVPEPVTLALVGFGLLALRFVRRRRR